MRKPSARGVKRNGGAVARQKLRCWKEPSFAAGAMEFFDVGKVLQASCGLYGDDEIGFSEVVQGPCAVARCGCSDFAVEST